MEEVEEITFASLEPELLCLCLAHLGGRGQAKAAATCKLFCLLVSEIAVSTPYLAGALTPHLTLTLTRTRTRALALAPALALALTLTLT